MLTPTLNTQGLQYDQYNHNGESESAIVAGIHNKIMTLRGGAECSRSWTDIVTDANVVITVLLLP